MSTPSDDTATASVTPAVSSTKLAEQPVEVAGLVRQHRHLSSSPAAAVPCSSRLRCTPPTRLVRNRWISSPSTAPMMPHPGAPPRRVGPGRPASAAAPTGTFAPRTRRTRPLAVRAGPGRRRPGRRCRSRRTRRASVPLAASPASGRAAAPGGDVAGTPRRRARTGSGRRHGRRGWRRRPAGRAPAVLRRGRCPGGSRPRCARPRPTARRARPRGVDDLEVGHRRRRRAGRQVGGGGAGTGRWRGGQRRAGLLGDERRRQLDHGGDADDHRALQAAP